MFWRIVAVVSVCAWLLLGTLVYFFVNNCFTEETCSSSGDVITTETCGWTFAQSFYYSVQTGLSIGFGLLSETKDLSRAYSIFHILAGSSFIGGVLSWFASLALERHANAQNVHEKVLARFARACRQDAYEGFDSNQLRDLMAKYPPFMADLYFKLEKDHAKVKQLMKTFNSASELERQDLAVAALSRAKQELGLFDKKATLEEIMTMHRDSRTLWRKSVKFLQHRQRTIIVFGSFILWVFIGALFTCLQCDFTVIQGIYFAVAGMSTAGLQATCEDPTAPGTNVVFIGFYALIGVPIFGVALGTFANVLIDGHIERQTHRKMHEKITSAEAQFAQHILGHEVDRKINLSEYIEIQLIRTGAVDRDTLESLRAEFNKLNPDSDGTIPREQLVKGSEHTIQKHRPDVQGAGYSGV